MQQLHISARKNYLQQSVAPSFVVMIKQSLVKKKLNKRKRRKRRGPPQALMMSWPSIDVHLLVTVKRKKRSLMCH